MTVMSEQGSQKETEVDTEELLVGFLSNYDFLHEYRLQKLAYAAELLHAEESDNNIPLVGVGFKPYMYGSYSESVAETLDGIDSREDVVVRPDFHHGERTEAYRFTDEGDTGDLPQHAEDIVDRLHEATKSATNEELAEWSKESWLYCETEYDEPMDFEEYGQKVDDDEIDSDIEAAFPEAKSGD